MKQVKERKFVNPFKLFFGNMNESTEISQDEAIENSGLTKKEKEQLKKALSTVDKFAKDMNNTVENVKHQAKPKNIHTNESVIKVKVEDREIGD